MLALPSWYLAMRISKVAFGCFYGLLFSFLSAFRSRHKARAYKWFRFRPPTPFSYANISLFVIRRHATILDRIDMMLIPRFTARPRKVSRLFGSAFTVQSPLQDLANIRKDMTL
jgi:hypothetical protein